jgi:hypothetical protein
MITKDSLYLKGPGFSGYAYRADLYCEDCGSSIIDALPDGPFDDVWVGDNNNVPSPIFFPESECAQHCATCGLHLYGPQTKGDCPQCGCSSPRTSDDNSSCYCPCHARLDAVVFQGDVRCVECLPKGMTPDDPKVQPIFADSEWTSYFTCDMCGREHVYIRLTTEAEGGDACHEHDRGRALIARMTRRERLERKVEKRRQWAIKADARAAERFKVASNAVTGIPMGQPILVGHHSEGRHRAALKRSNNNMSKGCEARNLATRHRQCASGLERQLDRSVFSDDENAIERLEARITEREAERDRWKAYNASCRKGPPDETLLNDAQRAALAMVRRVAAYQIGKHGEAPGYVATNLSANIRTDRQRLERLANPARKTAMAAKDGAECA